MSIQVGLKVTGIYFGTNYSLNSNFQVTVPDAPTVKDVMDAAVVAVGAGAYPGATFFNYTDNMVYVNSISVNYDVPPAPTLPMGPSPAAVFYTLLQQSGLPYDQALQYYHYRPTTLDDGTYALIQLNITNDVLSYVKSPAQPILDGDIIAWRLVTIETAPLPSARGIGSAAKSATMKINRMAKP